MSTVKTILLTLFVYIITKFSGISTLVLLLVLILLYDFFSITNRRNENPKEKQSQLIDFISSCPKPPKDNMPKWILFPEYEKARFINHIIYVLWNPHLKLSFEQKLRSRLDWNMEVQKAKFKKLSHLSVNAFDLGTSPPLISGIKTCELKCDLCARHIEHNRVECEQKFCSLEIDFVFVSDDIKFGITAGYKNIKATVTLSKVFLSGSVLLKLCDFVNLIPGFSRYTLSFLNFPKFDFDLSFKTGSLKMSYLPKISKIIEPFLKKTVWTAFVYPRYKSFKIKTRKIEEMRTAGKLIKYAQISSETEGSLCLEIKEVAWLLPATKEQDPAEPSILEKANLYQDELGYAWICIAGVKGTTMIHKTQHIHAKLITRRLKWNECFSFKNLTLNDPAKPKFSPLLDFEIKVLGKKWDELLGQCSINLRSLFEQRGYDIKNHVVDVVRHNYTGEPGFKKVGTMTLDITYLAPNSFNKKSRKFAMVLTNVLRKSLADRNFFIIKSNLKKVSAEKEILAYPVAEISKQKNKKQKLSKTTTKKNNAST